MTVRGSPQEKRGKVRLGQNIERFLAVNVLRLATKVSAFHRKAVFVASIPHLTRQCLSTFDLPVSFCDPRAGSPPTTTLWRPGTGWPSRTRSQYPGIGGVGGRSAHPGFLLLVRNWCGTGRLGGISWTSSISHESSRLCWRALSILDRVELVGVYCGRRWSGRTKGVQLACYTFRV